MRFAVAAAFLTAGLSPALAERPITFSSTPSGRGAIVIPMGSAADLARRAPGLDAGARETILRALDSVSFEYKPRSTLTVRGIDKYTQVVVIGVGSASLSAAELRDIGGLAATETASYDGPVALLAAGLGENQDQAASDLAVGARLGGYVFDRHKTPDLAKPAVAGRNSPLTIVTAADDAVYMREGRALAAGVSMARDLVSEPANIVFPESFVDRTRAAFKGIAGASVEVLDVPAMEQLGMGAILSVGRGSARPPRMLLVRYEGRPGAPIVLAGKGITFDSGGISLKPGTGMWQMKGDMGGAAAVIGAVYSLAASRAQVSVVGIAALAENMPGPNATRPGDIVKAINGKTIEVINTDAEGRLVLADAVAYAERQYRPAAIVDIATLTGAVSSALGDEYAGLLTRNDGLAAQLTAAGAASGEELWRLPLHENYADDMKSAVADIKNSAEGGGPGAGLGAHFIAAFVNSTPWAHLDIAGVDYRTKALPTVPEGLTGFGVRLLDRFVRDFRPVVTN